MDYLSLLLALLPSSVCSIGTPLVRASDDIVPIYAEAIAGWIPVEVTDALRTDSRIPDSVVQVRGYQFVVREVGPGPDRLSEGDLMTVVPWGYAEDCTRDVWSEEGWVSEGQEVVFLLGAPRPGADSTFDVLGWHTPYPAGEFFRFRARPLPPEDRSEWLDARGYFELVSRLPTSTRFTYQNSAEDGLAVFADGPPEWASTFPGYEILRRYRGG